MKDGILFMQVRLINLAAKKWGKSLEQTVEIFKQHDIFSFIRGCYEIFHTEGDEAVMYDIQKLIDSDGGLYAAI